MKKITASLAIILICIIPVSADVDQKAKLNGDNVITVKVNQEAWNYGSGSVKQEMEVSVTGNYQTISQDTLVGISDPDYEGYINNTINGFNLIKVDLNQEATNRASGNIVQGIDVVVEGNIQTLDQRIIEIIA